MKDIKLVISDLDGTLLSDDKKMSIETVNSIKKLKDKGILFGLATGRAKVTLDNLIPYYGLDGLIDAYTCMNGNVVSIDDKTTSYYPLSNEEVMYIYNNSLKFKDIVFGVYEDETNTIYTNGINKTLEDVVRINSYIQSCRYERILKE